MSDIVIAAENLSKRYLVGHQSAQRERYTLREIVALEAHNFARKSLDFVCGRQIVQGDEVEEFWALRDVSFEIKRGEVVGIIGRNGAGKSTLLKVLSRITEPSEGRVRIRGRVASLLEVGTGFHPELTGRENIYLNGAILGMSRAEVERKFDEIVEFSEIEKFLDTPVKRYSSGMYVRLAFAVAAHLEPEILIVDEVLAVGDAVFQKKCLGKMRDVVHGGARTVLFVSHNMNAIGRLCDRAILLVNGSVEADAPTGEVVHRYIRGSGDGSDDFGSSFVPQSADDKNEADDVILLSASLQSSSGQQRATFSHEDEIVVSMRYRVRRPINNVRIAFRLQANDGTVVLTTGNTDRSAIPTLDAGVYLSTCKIPPRFLNQGGYFLTLTSDVPFAKINFFYEQALSFSVESSLIDNYLGAICILLPWTTHTETREDTRIA